MNSEEEGDCMNRTLRGKLQTRISIVAVVSFILSAIFTCLYFKLVLEDQFINNDKIKQRQTTRQMQYMTESTASFASFLMISEQLQTFYEKYAEADTYEKFALIQETVNFLQRNKGLNKEIASFIFVLPSGEAIWSEAQNDDYISVKMQEPWYRHYTLTKEESAFTEMHLMYRNGNAMKETPFISYIRKIRDMKTGAPLGEFIVNLDYSDFASVLSFGSESFDGYLWLNEDGNVLFENKGTPDGLAKIVKANSSDGIQDSDESVLNVHGGYALVDRFSENSWRLVSFTSFGTLLYRSQFAVYILVVFTLTSTILALILMLPVVLNITKPIYRLYHAMNLVSDGNLQTSVKIETGDELEKLGQGFNRMVAQLQVHLEESVRYEQEKRDMEIELLLSQINPHFVYNTLNTVIYMAQKQMNQDIVKMTAAFITLLQDTVKIGEAHRWITLREEMKIVGEYSLIQAYRYQDMFELSWDAEEEALDGLLPRNLLQPLVENAIFHGIRPLQHEGWIRISAVVSNNLMTIRITDNGVGIPKEKVERIMERSADKTPGHGLRNIGLANTMKRIDRTYKGAGELYIESADGEGTSIILTLPYIVNGAYF